MRIALFTEVFLPKIDGITNRLRHTIACLREAGHEVRVFAPDTSVEEHAGARVVRIPATAFPPYPEVRASAPDPRIAWELFRFRPDVVHAVGPACLGIWGILAARAQGLPVVASYHTDLPGYAPRYGFGWLAPALWPLIRQVHNGAHLNLVPSRHTQRELREHGIHRVGIWRGGVDTVRFHPRRRSLAMRTRLAGGRPDGPVVLYAGRLSPEKSIEELAWVLEAVPEARLALVGDGPGRAALEQVFADDPVTFMGFLRGQELAEAFASADLFVMPSTTETLGFVVMEAMASGVPVLGADAGGIPDMIRHGENGLLFDPGSRSALVRAARELLHRPDKRRFFAEQGRKTAENASWENETRKLVDDYRRAVGLQRRSATGRLLGVMPPFGRIGHALLG